MAYDIYGPYLFQTFVGVCVLDLINYTIKVLLMYQIKQAKSNWSLRYIPYSHFCKYPGPDQETQCVFKQQGRDIYKSVNRGYGLNIWTNSFFDNMNDINSVSQSLWSLKLQDFIRQLLRLISSEKNVKKHFGAKEQHNSENKGYES